MTSFETPAFPGSTGSQVKEKNTSKENVMILNGCTKTRINGFFWEKLVAIKMNHEADLQRCFPTNHYIFFF